MRGARTVRASTSAASARACVACQTIATPVQTDTIPRNAIARQYGNPSEQHTTFAFGTITWPDGTEGLLHVGVTGRVSRKQNLVTGAYVRGLSRPEIARDLERLYAWFPRLKTRRLARAGLTSGGEQQMVAIGRALMTRPTLVLLDEPSMGLAPLIVEEIFEIVRQLNRESGVSFLLAEQNANLALRYTDFAYVLETGRVVASGPAPELAARDDIKDIYLGGGSSVEFKPTRH